METTAGFPYTEIQFDKRGAIHDQGDINQLNDLVESGITDLVVLSHGWNNDIAEARSLYTRLLTSVRTRINASGDGPPGIGVVGLLWPSKKFAEKELIPSGAAAAGGGSLDNRDLVDQLAALKGGFDPDGADQALEEMASLVPNLTDSKQAQREFVELSRSLLDAANVDPEVELEIPAGLLTLDGPDLLDELAKPGPLEPTTATVGAASAEEHGAAAFGFLGGIKAGAQRLLNLLTFYQMKQRAGVVGQLGVHDTLVDIADAHPALRIHLVGHSFGARLVTATLRGSDGSKPLTARSMSLLQAAYSHNGLAQDYEGTKDGYFRVVIDDDRVSGPIVITYTSNDKAVGVAYPLASRLKAPNAAAIVGGPEDIYGGMGRNGAQSTPEAQQGRLEAPGHQYAFAPGVVYNLNADNHVTDHGDVANEAVAEAVLAAVRV